MLPVFMMIMYSPLLVFFHDVPAYQAMKMSFTACLRNIMPFLLFGIVMLVIFFVVAIPFGLGFIVVFPLLYAASYVSYRQVLTSGG